MLNFRCWLRLLVDLTTPRSLCSSSCMTCESLAVGWSSTGLGRLPMLFEERTAFHRRWFLADRRKSAGHAATDPLWQQIRLEFDPQTQFGQLTQSEIAGALADHQVVRLSRSGVLECQDRPITRRSTITQFVYLLACLRQRHRFLICISNERNCVIIVFVQTQRARIAISAATNRRKTKRMKILRLL